MTYPHKDAPTNLPVLDVITQRWSPVCFSDEALTDEQIQTLFEAARWAPSSYNEQPWRFVYAAKNDNGREALENLLLDGNAWAKDAGLLIVAFGKKAYDKNDKPNRHYLYDTGCAMGYLFLQATSMGLIGHEMGGFRWQDANTELGVPDTMEAVAMMAVGHPGDPDTLSEELHARQISDRARLPLSDIAKRGRW